MLKTLSNIIERIKDNTSGKTPANKERSNKWRTVRKHFLEKNPTCAICDSNENLQVHHMLPFHMDYIWNLKRPTL